MDEPKRLYWNGDPMNDWANGARMDLRMRLALDIVKHCALVSGIEDGEDSQGRAKGKLLPAPQVAERAFGIAERLVELGEERGYIMAPALTTPRMASAYHGAFNESRYFRDNAENEKYWKDLPAAIRRLNPEAGGE